MSSGEEENVEGIENAQIDESDPVFRSVAEADVSLDEMMSLACRQGKLDIVELLLESGAHVDYRNKAGNTPLLEACSQGHVDVARYLLDHHANIDAPTETTSDSALTWACTLGNEAIVKLLLQRKANVEHRTKDGCTALMFAALAGHVKVAAMLLDHGAEINVESDSNKDSPLTFACWKGHCDVVELLLLRSANIEHRTKEGFTPLMFAALGGHTDVAAKLLEQGAKVNIPSGSNNDIPLTSACWKGHHDVVKLLLEFNSNIEHRTKDGCTPLMLAAREGHYSVAKLILDSKAEVNKPSGSENNIPLTLSCWKGHTQVVELLLEHKSNIEHRNKAGCTPLMLAAREGHVETTELLLNKGAEINKPSGSNDDTPLTLACWKGHVGVVDLLLKHCSKVDHQTKTGCTPLMEATREGHVAVAERLLNHTADVELPDNYGQSPLFMACWKGHRDVAELLLEHNANRDCRTKTGITPLFQACRENHVEVVKLLLEYGASVNAPFPNSRENPLTLAAEKGHAELVSLLLRRNANVECHTKKGCTPFHLSCKEGHLSIAIALQIRGADTEAVDSRNNSPLVAAMKNGHSESTEWLLNVVNHLPSEEQCQKCLVAPIEDKDRHEEVMLGRTKCYDLVTKAKKAKEQKVQRNTEIFLKELENEKEREDNRKKKAAAKRRDKRKRRKAAKENELANIKDDLPLENRPQEVAEAESDGEGSDIEDDHCRQTALVLREFQNELVKNAKKKQLPMKLDKIREREINEIHYRESAKLEDRSRGRSKLNLEAEEASKNFVGSNERQHQQHQDPTDYVERRSSAESTKTKNTRKRSEECNIEAKEPKKKAVNTSSAHKGSKCKGEKSEPEIKARNAGHGTMVNCVSIETSNAKREPSPRHSSLGGSTTSGKHSTPNTPNTPSTTNKHYTERTDTTTTLVTASVNTTQPVSPRERNRLQSSPKSSPEAEKGPDNERGAGRRCKEGVEGVDGSKHGKGRVVSRGSTTMGQSSTTCKPMSSDADREQKPVHSPRSKQHPQLLKGEENWKEVTRTTNAKTMVVQLTAPNALCGRVIGRGGSKINSITEESGAQITIGKPEPKNPTDRVITIKGSSKAVQRAKFLVTQALNTPSTIGQPTAPTTTATTSVAINTSDRSNTTSVPVRGNYAAIASSSSSEWPTIMQANTMSTTTPVTKTAGSEERRKSPEIGGVGETKHEKLTHSRSLSSGSSDSSLSIKGTNSKSTSPVSVAKTTAAWSSQSAWKPNRPPVTQSEGVSTRAVTTCVSSCYTTAASTNSSVTVMSYDSERYAMPQAAAEYHGESDNHEKAVAPENSAIYRSGTSAMEFKIEGKVPITTVAVSTSAETTTAQRDYLAPDGPQETATSCYGAIGSNKPAPHESPGGSLGSSFGAIGQITSSTTVFKESVPEFSPRNKEPLISEDPISKTNTETLSSPLGARKAKFPCYSPWSTQSAGIPDIGRDSTFSTGPDKYQGPLPGMELFAGSNSLFSGSLPSYPWSTGEDGDKLDRSRSISWSGQNEYQDNRLGTPAVAKGNSSPPSQKSMSEATLNLQSDLQVDPSAFKPLAATSIWGQVTSQVHSSTLSVVCDEDTPDKQAWNNSDSTSSSRSSSRQELSSIMDSDTTTNSGVWNSCAFAEDITPTPQVGSNSHNMPHPDQSVHMNTQWGSNRGAYSAPSSPSLPRSHSQPDPVSTSAILHPSVDDSAVRSWTAKQKSPRSHSSSDQPSGWSQGGTQTPRRSSVDMSQSYTTDRGIANNPWQYPPRTQDVYTSGFGVREPWRETAPSSGIDVSFVLKRLTLEKYMPVFEDNKINGNRLAQMNEEDLECLGIPKGPRLKLLHAIHGTRLGSWPATINNSFPNHGNGFVKAEVPCNAAPHPTKKSKPDPTILGTHNHVINQSDPGLSPSAHKKMLLKQGFDHTGQQAVIHSNHGNQPLLSLMSPGRGVNQALHGPLLGQEHSGGLPPRPHSASGNLNSNHVFSANSSNLTNSSNLSPHGDQQFPYMGQQGHYVNHVTYSQPQVYYPGGYYYYYPQQQ